MLLKYPSKTSKTEKSTTTDLLEGIQRLSDDWFTRGLPERPKDVTSKTKSSEEKEEEPESDKNP